MTATSAALQVPVELAFKDSLRERLPAVREQLGLNQQQLAKLLDVPPSTVNRWEKGRSLPSFKHLLAIYRHAADKGVDPALFPVAGFQDQGLQDLADAGAVGGGLILILHTISGPGVLAKVLGAIAQKGADVRAVIGKQLPDSPGTVEVLVDLESGSATLGDLISAVYATNTVKELSCSTARSRPRAV